MRKVMSDCEEEIENLMVRFDIYILDKARIKNEF